MFVRSFTPIQRNVVSLRMVLDANIIIGTNASDRSDCDASVANGSRPRHRGQTSGSWGRQKEQVGQAQPPHELRAQNLSTSPQSPRGRSSLKSDKNPAVWPLDTTAKSVRPPPLTWIQPFSIAEISKRLSLLHHNTHTKRACSRLQCSGCCAGVGIGPAHAKWEERGPDGRAQPVTVQIWPSF